MTLLKAAKDLHLPEKQGYPVNMGHIFRTWFQWGFFTMVMQIWIGAMLMFSNPMNLLGRYASTILIFFGIVSFINSAWWVVLGAIWRFSQAGQVTTGSKLVQTAAELESNSLWQKALRQYQYEFGYQLQSGDIMWYFYMIVVPAIGVITIGAMIYFVT